VRWVMEMVVGMEVVEHALPPFLQSCLQTGRHGTGMQPRVTDSGAGRLLIVVVGMEGKRMGKGW